jgi:hypothetical protein
MGVFCDFTSKERVYKGDYVEENRVVGDDGVVMNWALRHRISSSMVSQKLEA